MTEQLFVPTGAEPPTGAVRVAEDHVMVPSATGRKRVEGTRYMVTWKMMGTLGQRLVLAETGAGVFAYMCAGGPRSL